MFYAKKYDQKKEIENIIGKYIPNLNYISDKVEIRDGKIIKFDKSLADAGSKFMTWL